MTGTIKFLCGPCSAPHPKAVEAGEPSAEHAKTEEKMARRTKQEAEQTREAILDAAELVFSEHGVAHTSLDAVARQAGVTRGAVYHHFANKLDLFRALMQRIELPLFQRFEAATDDGVDDPVKAMRDSTLFAIEELIRDPHSRRTLDILFHRCEFVGELWPIIEGQHEKMHWFIERSAEALARAQANGLIRADLDPRFGATLYRTLVTGIVRDWLFSACRVDVRALSQRMIDHLLASFGYQPCEGARP